MQGSAVDRDCHGRAGGHAGSGARRPDASRWPATAPWSTPVMSGTVVVGQVERTMTFAFVAERNSKPEPASILTVLPATQETAMCSANTRDPPQVCEIGTVIGP